MPPVFSYFSVRWAKEYQTLAQPRHALSAGTRQDMEVNLATTAVEECER
jgi:hypothetical protein